MADGDVIVEGHAIMSNIGGAYPEPAIWEDRADALWEELTARMLAGDAPDPERGD
ncbi:MAG: hypothetical protein HYY29_03690 [Chloroflexi bacterium]|nr:hypothetical protein [Chloroflexota bacterium]